MALHMHDALYAGDQDLPCPGALLFHVERRNAARGVMATAHDVVTEPDGTRRLTGGHPISREDARATGLALLGGAVTREVWPENLLNFDGLRMSWYTPARCRRIRFHRDRTVLRGVDRQEVPQPALLWAAEPGRLHLWALAGDERPNDGTPVYQAPYLNTYPDGWVCGGTVQWPDLRPGNIADWERMFHDSTGTVVWAERLTLYPGGHDALWCAMLRADHFPVASLVPAQMTVLDAINQERRSCYPESAPAEIIVPALEVLP